MSRRKKKGAANREKKSNTKSTKPDYEMNDLRDLCAVFVPFVLRLFSGLDAVCCIPGMAEPAA